MNILKTNYILIGFEDQFPIQYEVGSEVFIINGENLVRCIITEIIDTEEKVLVQQMDTSSDSVSMTVTPNDIADGYYKYMNEEQCMNTGDIASVKIITKYCYLDDLYRDRDALLYEGDICIVGIPSAFKFKKNRINTIECKIVNINERSITLRSLELKNNYTTFYIHNENKNKYIITRNNNIKGW